MRNSLALIMVLWLVARFVYGVDFIPLVDLLGRLIAAFTYPLLGIGLLTALALPGITLVCNGLGFYTLMYSLAKLFFWLSSFLICLVSLVAVLFWLDLGVNLWGVLGKMALLPFFLAAGGAFSLHVADFNYPVKEALAPLLMLAGLSLLFVSWSAFSAAA